VFFDPRGGTHFEGRWQPPVNDEGFSEEGIPEAGVSAETSGREKRLKRADSEDLAEDLAEGLAEGLPTKNSRRGGGPEDLIQNLAPEGRRRGRVPEDLVESPPKEDRRRGGVPQDLVESPPKEDRRRRGVPEDLVADLLTQNRRKDVLPDGRTPSARWKRESDIPDSVYFRALEAIQKAWP
jgi:hypothetical protein